jgi:predicted dehydrogenase
MGKCFKAGIIGCGFIANQKHLPALAKLKSKGRVELAAFCDLIVDRAKEAARVYGKSDALVCTEYRRLLEIKDIDVVYVLTPNRSHAEITLAAFSAGKHVLCEKPMAAAYADAKAMCDAAGKSGKLLTIGYQNRCIQDAMYLKKCVAAGMLGDIYYAQAYALRRRGIPTWGIFMDKDAQGGGALIDIGTHALDMTLWLMDNYEPKSVMGATFNKLGKGGGSGNSFGPWNPADFKDVEDSAIAHITMKNGAVISLQASWAMNTLDLREQKVVLCGTKAGADMNDGLRFNGEVEGELCVWKPKLARYGVPGTLDATWCEADTEAEMWYDALEGRGDPMVKPSQALCITRILEGVYQSAATGTLVEF